MTPRQTQPPPLSQDAPLDTYRAQRYTVKPSTGREVLAFFGLFGAQVEGLGLDASHWQASIDFQKAQAQSVKFAFLRSSYGITPDTKFGQHWKGAKGKVLRGLYHYYLDTQDAKQQATAAFNACQGDKGELPPVLDLEDYGNADLTTDKVRDCLEWLTILFGKTPAIYTSKNVWDTHFGKQATWGLAYPLWLAQYPIKGWLPNHLTEVLKYPPTLPAPFAKWEFWQFTSSAPAPAYGVSGSVLDLNYAAPGVLAKYGDVPPVDPLPGEPTLKFTVIVPTLNIREQPNINAKDVGDLKAGDVITAQAVIPTTATSVWVKFGEKQHAALVHGGTIYLEPVI